MLEQRNTVLDFEEEREERRGEEESGRCWWH